MKVENKESALANDEFMIYVHIKLNKWLWVADVAVGGKYWK